eukprot:363925-Chlamydomonas_euryale.AAC.17
MHEGFRAFTPYVKPRQGDPCTKHSSRPRVEAYYACRGQGLPEAKDMHMHARKCPGAGGMHVYVHACRRPRAGLGLGRRTRPRSEAKTSMFCARMNVPGFRIRVNGRTGPSCIQHRLYGVTYACMNAHTHASTCMLHNPGI